MNVRVLVVDDHPVVRAGLVGLLSGEPDLEVVGEAADGAAALALVAAVTPDVVLMDLRSPARTERPPPDCCRPSTPRCGSSC